MDTVDRGRGRASGLQLGPSIVLFVALSLANASNYLFQVVMSRMLGPSDYSLLGGVYAVITVVGVSTGALQTAAAKSVAIRREADDLRESATLSGLVKGDTLVRASIRWGIPVTAVIALLSPLLAEFLRSGLGPALSLSLYAVPTALLAIGFGRLQGLEAFNRFAVLSLVIALARLGLGPLAISGGFGITGVVMTSVIISIVGGGWALRASREAGPLDAPLGDEVRRAGAALLLFWVMASIDVPMARNGLPPELAGQYAAASVIGKAVLWLPGALSLVMFPRVAQLRERGEWAHPPLIQALAITFALCVAAVGGLWAFGEEIIPLFFGDSYLAGARIAWKVGMIYLPFALVNLLVFYHLTRGRNRFLATLVVAFLIEVTFLGLFHGTIDQILTVMGGTSVLLFAALTLPWAWRLLSRHDPSELVLAVQRSAQPLDPLNDRSRHVDQDGQADLTARVRENIEAARGSLAAALEGIDPSSDQQGPRMAEVSRLLGEVDEGLRDAEAQLDAGGLAHEDAASVDRDVRYDRETCEVVARVLAPDDNAIDVGTHAGQILHEIVTHAPRGHHLAFEPIPSLATELRHRYPDVEVHEVALSDQGGIERFHHVITNPGYSGLRERRYDRPHEEVEVTEVRTERLDSIVPPHRPVRFIKVDVEGAELQVFRGARETIARHRPYIVFEHGLGAADFYGTRPEQVFALLTGCDLEVSTMRRWLDGDPALTQEAFVRQFESNENYYFIAYPRNA